MSQFLLLIYEEEAPYDTADQALFNEVMSAHQAFGQKYKDKLRGGEALKPTKTARTVRGGAVTDGPFLETKEVLGGYYVVEAGSLDEAVEIAKECPARFGCVEVREVMVFN
jgi:hypothetical protein